MAARPGWVDPLARPAPDERALARAIERAARDEDRHAPPFAELLVLGGVLGSWAGAALALLIAGPWLLAGLFIGIVAGALPLGAGLWLLGPSRRRPPLDGAVVAVARRRGGRFTAADVVSDTGLTFAEVEANLDRLCGSGHLHFGCDEASGVFVYVLPEPKRGAQNADAADARGAAASGITATTR